MVPERLAVLVARALLAVGSIAVATLLMGPFQGAERLFLLDDKQAHTLAFFAFASVLFVAFPTMRRNDLAMAAVALAAASEVAQALVGRDGNVADAMADTSGVLMALAPTYLDRIRTLARGEAPLRRRGDRRRSALVGAARPGSSPSMQV